MWVAFFIHVHSSSCLLILLNVERTKIFLRTFQMTMCFLCIWLGNRRTSLCHPWRPNWRDWNHGISPDYSIRLMNSLLTRPPVDPSAFLRHPVPSSRCQGHLSGHQEASPAPVICLSWAVPLDILPSGHGASQCSEESAAERDDVCPCRMPKLLIHTLQSDSPAPRGQMNSLF